MDVLDDRTAEVNEMMPKLLMRLIDQDLAVVFRT
jgi:hypothetical protein